MKTPMQPHSSVSMRGIQQGMALLVSVVLTAVILLAIVTASATVSLGARRGGIDERASYTALLAAESGINTFETRVKKAGKLPVVRGVPKEPTPAQKVVMAKKLDDWRANNPDLFKYGKATLKPRGGWVVPGQVFSVESEGKDLSARRTVLQDYEMSFPAGVNISADAALKGLVGVTVGGNAGVSGPGVSEATSLDYIGHVRNTTLKTLANGQFSLEITKDGDLARNDGSLFLEIGDYIQLNGSTYKVTGLDRQQTGNERYSNVILKPVGSVSAPTAVSSSMQVTRIKSVLTATTLAGVPKTNLPVSDVSFFGRGSIVQVGGKAAQVTAKDVENKTITVQWADGAPSTLNEGTPIYKDVKGVISGGGITEHGSKVDISGGQVANDTVLKTMTADDLFQETFGSTKSDFLASLVPTATGDVLDVLANAGVVYHIGDLSFQGGDSLCGKGVLIVKGDLRVNKVCSAGFEGFIYVMGDLDQQGTAKYKGAVVVEGSAKVNSHGGGEDPKIAYDPKLVMQYGQSLGTPIFRLVPGSWRPM